MGPVWIGYAPRSRDLSGRGRFACHPVRGQIRRMIRPKTRAFRPSSTAGQVDSVGKRWKTGLGEDGKCFGRIIFYFLESNG